MKISYFAKDRGFLISGHAVGTEYEFVIGRRQDDRSFRIRGRNVKALDGTPRNQLEHVETRWQISTSAVTTSAENAQMDEFLSSVFGGEQFTIDLESNSLAEDVAAMTVSLSSSTLRQSRVLRQQGKHRYPFEIEKR